MARLKRYVLQNHSYFITTKTLNNAPIFLNEKVAELFLETIFSLKDRYKFLLLAFVVMPDHIHLILIPDSKNLISSLMQKVKGLFAKKYRDLTGENGSIWQKSFYDFVICSEDKLLEKARYIHQNPVRKGIVFDEKDYRFSSAFPGVKTDWGII